MGSKSVRSIVVGLSLLVFVLLSAFVIAQTTLSADIVRIGNPSNRGYADVGANISGTAFNLSLTIVGNSTHGNNIVNVSFMFYYKKNSSVMRNITIQNFTTNQTEWNTTLDTTSFPEGIYNITVMVWNYSVEAGVTNVLINDSIWTNVTFDNTPPMLNFSTGNPGVNSSVLDGGKNFTNSSGPLTLVLFADDKRPGSNVNLSLTGVVVSITNGTGYQFNRTAVNNSGNWTIIINVSQLKPGLITVFAYVNDTAGNRNTTKPFNFTVNTPPNVTIFQLLNISTLGRKQRLTVNISVINTSMTSVVDGGLPNSRVNVTLNFDNASGTDFNITMNISGGDPLNITRELAGALVFFRSEINASQLVAGLHTVTILANDSRDNVNKTMTFQFLVDNTVPVVNYSPNSIVNTTLSGANYTVASGNQTIAIYASDTERSSAGNGSIHTVVVYVSNGTQGTPFNMTTANNGTDGSGPFNFTLSLNVSNLIAGITTIRIFANDTADNLNTTGTFTFTVNTPPNVTIWTNQSINLSDDGPNQRLIINLSVINRSMFVGIPNSRANITLVFDNSTGTDFNITMNISGGDPLNITRYVTNRHTFFVSEINLSQLVEGLHTVTIFTNDSGSNVNNTQTLTFRVDNTFPTATVSCTSNPTAGAIVTCTCSGSDSGTGTKSVAFLGGVATSESTTATNTGATSESSVCVVTDHAGHRTEKKGSWTTQASSGGGGGSGGASGGSSSGGGTGAAATYEKKVWTSINAGEVATVTPRNPEFSVEAVEFKVSDTVYGAWAKVEPITKSELPAEALTQLTGKVHDTIEISVNKLALKDEKVSDRTVKFKVPKIWLTENSVDKNSVVLMRFDDSMKKWQELATTVGEDDGTNVKYTAQTPGFSFFAIAEKGAASGATVVEPTAPTGAATTTPETMTKPSTTTTTKASEPSSTGSSALWWIVAAVIVVAAVVYFVRRRKA